MAVFNIIVKLSIHVVSFYLILNKFLEPLLLTLLITELIATISVLLLYSLLSIYFYKSARQNTVNFSIFVLRNYFTVSLKKRVVTTITERVDIIIGALILSEQGLGILARAKTFTSIVRPVLKSLLVPANAKIFNELLVKDNSYLNSKNVNKNFINLCKKTRVNQIINISLLTSLLFGFSTFFSRQLHELNEFIVPICVIMSALIFKNVIRGYSTLTGSIKMKIAPLSFIYQRQSD